MTTIYLIRHGQKESYPGNPGLTELGKRQAQATGRYLQEFDIHKLFASPFKRTLETCEEISKILGLNYDLSDDVVERMNWSSKNVDRSDFASEWIKATHNRDYTPKFGDSSFTTGERVRKFIQSIQAPEQNIAIVSHGGAILDYLRTEFGDETITTLRKKYDFGEDYEMLNCAINKIMIDEETKLEFFNYTEHLPQDSE